MNVKKQQQMNELQEQQLQIKRLLEDVQLKIKREQIQTIILKVLFGCCVVVSILLLVLSFVFKYQFSRNSIFDKQDKLDSQRSLERQKQLLKQSEQQDQDMYERQPTGSVHPQCVMHNDIRLKVFPDGQHEFV